MIIDSHCHLQFKSFDDHRAEVIERCIQKNIIMNTIGTQMDTSKKAVDLANQYDQIYATVGLHPIQSKKVTVEEEETMFVAKGEDFDTAYYKDLILSCNKVIAVGETGLDAYHVPKNIPLEQVFNDQWDLFMKHVELADMFNLPIVIHVRDAHKEMIRRLQKLNRPTLFKAVVHCFTGSWEDAQAYLDLGFYLGFTGVVTFPPKKTDPAPQLALQEVVEKVPIDRILVETDAPFLAPQAYRGEQSEPWMTEEVIKYIADVRNLSYDEFREQTFQNTCSLFTKLNI